MTLSFTFGCREVSAPIITLSPMAIPKLASDTFSLPLLPEDDLSLCGGDLICSLPCTNTRLIIFSYDVFPLTVVVVVAGLAAAVSIATG